jgi:hypothetical protein
MRRRLVITNSHLQWTVEEDLLSALAWSNKTKENKGSS